MIHIQRHSNKHLNHFLLLFAFLLFSSNFTLAQIGIQKSNLDTLLALGLYDEVIAVQKRVVEGEPENGYEHFLLSNYYALDNRKNLAIHHLENAWEFGYRDIELAWDKDFDSIKKLKGFKKIVRKLKDKYIQDNPGVDYELAFSIIERYEHDQWIRFRNGRCKGVCSQEKIIELKNQKDEIDSLNGIFLEDCIERYGFLTASQVGSYAQKSFSSLFMHAPLPLMEKYFLEFEAYCHTGKPNQAIAYVTDHILYQRMGVTLYGTKVCKDEKGNYCPCPILHEELVEERRKKYRMMSLKAYLAVYGIDYQPKK